MIAWLVLIGATVLSWRVGTGHGFGSPVGASTVVVVVALVKVRMIGRYFMELRHAPRVLQAVFDGYCVVLCSVLLGVFLWV